MKKLLLSVSMFSLVSGQLYAAVTASYRDEDLRSHTVRRLPMQLDMNPFEDAGKPQVSKADVQNAPLPVETTEEEPKFDALPVSTNVLSTPEIAEDTAEQQSKLVFKSKEEALQFVEDLLKEEERQRKIASGEIILEDDPDYYQKMAISYAKKTGWAAFDVFKPVLISGGTRIAVNGLVDLFAPVLVDAAGSLGGTLASKSTSFLTNWDSSGTLENAVRWFGASQARGETLRHMGDLANAMEIYGPAAILSAYKAGKFAVNGTQAAFTSAKSAFTSTDDAEVKQAKSTPTPNFFETESEEGSTFTFNNIEALLKFHEDDAKAKEYQRKVANNEIILEDDPNYTRKMVMSYAYTTAWTAFEISKPILFNMGTHILVNVAVDAFGPLLVDVAGDIGKSLAIRGTSMITDWDPSGSMASAAGWLGSTQARGEMFRNMGTIANAVEKYGPPAIVTTYKAAKAAVTGSKAAISKATDGIKSIGKRIGGFFKKSKAPAAAAAA